MIGREIAPSSIGDLQYSLFEREYCTTPEQCGELDVLFIGSGLSLGAVPYLLQQGIIHVSAVAQLGAEPQEQAVIVQGEHGRLEVLFPRTSGPTLYEARDGQPRRPLPVPNDLPEGGESADARLLTTWATRSVADRLFIDAIREDRPLAPTFADGVKVQEIIDAAFESSRRGVRVAIP